MKELKLTLSGREFQQLITRSLKKILHAHSVYFVHTAVKDSDSDMDLQLLVLDLTWTCLLLDLIQV